MGTQASSLIASNNEWAGSWTANINYGTWVVAGSTATDSPLWVSAAKVPPNNDGTAIFSEQYGATNTLFNSTGGDYQCGGVTNNRSFPLPAQGEDSPGRFIANTSAFRTLLFNDSILIIPNTLIFSNHFWKVMFANLWM